MYINFNYLYVSGPASRGMIIYNYDMVPISKRLRFFKMAVTLDH